MAEVRIGVSGWSYPHWRGAFYPEGLRVKDQLAHCAARFPTLEINGSFYRLPSEKAVAAWRDAAPEGFVFAWKASRFITHFRRLKNVDDSLKLVFGRMEGLGDKMGPALFQLPPQMKADPERLAGFLSRLPKSRRVAIEFRHPSWYDEAVWALLRDHDVAFCVSDHHDAPAPWVATAGFVYVRGHGPGGGYSGDYSDAELKAWARRIRTWADEGRDAWVYFDNDIGAAAPKDAERLIALTGRAAGASRSRPRPSASG
jgi:uncharacterized protein YecE (DUF72 family)